MQRRSSAILAVAIVVGLSSGQASATSSFTRGFVSGPTHAADQLGLELIFADGFESGLLTEWDSATGNPPGTSLPPDPSVIAPPLDPTIAVDTYESNKFLWSAPVPVQVGVSEGAIDPSRVSLLRGRTFAVDGSPLRGVRVSVHSDSRFGFTFSRADGYFDLAVNGGGIVTLAYRKPGYFEIQRTIAAPARDFGSLEDAVLLHADEQVTEIASGATEMQVARGSVENDLSGARQATMLFPAGVAAEMLFADGSSQALTTFQVRATEYTVGESGVLSMPAPLPEYTGYTYAVELSADEAIAAGAERVQFSEPVVLYLENFLGFPVGEAVPVGSYDRTAAQWIPEINGRIIQILAVTGGVAELDIDGFGLPADPQALLDLGVTEAERQRLAILYPVGQSLWRTPVSHFTPWDCNWPYGPPLDAEAPPEATPEQDPPDDPLDPEDPSDDDDARDEEDPCVESGSIIECENQTLGETVDLVGVPFRLHYQSDRVGGRVAARRLRFRLSGPTVPASLKRIELRVFGLGGMHKVSFLPQPNLTYSADWTTVDRYGRQVHSTQPLVVDVGFVYPSTYYSTWDQVEASFNRLPIGRPAIWVGSTRSEITVWRRQSSTLGQMRYPQVLPWVLRGEGLGGWTIDQHHRFDPRTRLLVFGSGGRKRIEDLAFTAPRVVGTGVAGSTGDGGPGALARIDEPSGLLLAPDGSLYLSDLSQYRVRRLGSDGTIETVAGNGNPCDLPGCGDGGPAWEAQLVAPSGLGLDANGALLIADGACVRRVAVDGTISTAAGTCFDGVPPHLTEGSDCENCPALDAQLYSVVAVLALPGGGFFFSDRGANRIRHVGVDGIVSTIAGTGTYGFGGDGGPATEALLASPAGISLTADLEILIADSGNDRVRKISRAGVITTVAGVGSPGFSGDGGPAQFAELYSPLDVRVGEDGSVLVADTGNGRIRRVSPASTISTVAGSGSFSPFVNGAYSLGATLEFPTGVAPGRQGDFYVADPALHHILHVSDSRPVARNSEILIPSRNGAWVWVFDAAGRHLRTVNALTGATVLTFAYSPSGKLQTITDADGNGTAIQRNGAGQPTAIVGPYGQVTTLSVDSNGFLDEIRGAAGEAWTFSYSAQGLMLTAQDPRLHETAFGWDGHGRLSAETDAAGGVRTLSRWNFGPNWVAARYGARFTSAEGRESIHSVFEGSLSRMRWHQLVTEVDHSLTTRTELGAGGDIATLFPDGYTSATQAAPDPVWGLLVPRTSSSTATTPAGLSRTTDRISEGGLADPLDPLSLVGRAETVSQNGNTFTATYDAGLRRWLSSSPLGRQSVLLTDEVGRPTSSQRGPLLSTSFAYDSHGRLSSTARGAGPDERRIDFTYDAFGRLATITDPLLRQVIFSYDAANRVTSQTLPGGRAVLFGWDAKGNLTSLTPPGRTAHTFSYTAVDMTEEYAPPDVGQGPPATTYEFNLDKKPTLITRPDGQTIGLTYDQAQRLTSLTSPRGTATIDYDPVTGHVSTLTTPEGNSLSYTMDGPLVLSTTWAGEVSGSVERTYDNDFRLASISVNGANPVSYTYDDDGLLIQAGAMTLTRDPATGFLTATTLGVVTTSYTYSPFGELSQMSAAVSGTPIYTATYTRDKLGRITTKVEMIQGVTKTYDYAYDAAGRLGTVTVDGILEAEYDYDLNGNRLSKTTPSGTETGTYDAQDRMLTYGGASYSYTANGEMLSKTNGTDVTGFDYDAYGNLLAVSLPDGTDVAYVIDGRNRRIGKTVNGALTQGLLWQSQLAPIAELDDTGTVAGRFVYATNSNVPDYFLKGGSTYRILTDHLGSPRLAVDASTGAVARRSDYDEWGGVQVDTSPGFSPFAFAGGLSDPHSGLLRFGARDYRAETGNWTSKDILRLAGGDSNFFTYALADPVNNIDSAGLFNVVLGGGANGTAVTGAELSGGIFFNPGLFGQDADLGVLGSLAPTGGFQFGLDAFFGFVFGDPCKVQGSTFNVNLGVGPLSLTGFFDPESGDWLGGTVGVGPSFPPISASLSLSTTGTLSLNGN